MKHLLLALSLCLAIGSLDAGYVLRNGKLVNTKDLATLPVEEHYNLGLSALKEKNWEEAVRQFRVVTINFPLSSWGKEGFYYLGVAYFHDGDQDLSNQSFSEYLKENQNPKYFEETFQYKLAIADAFKNGARRHIMGYEKLPAWLPDKDLAISLYDEVISSLPNSDMAAKALLSKASIFKKREQFRECIDAYQSAIRKFPKSEFAAKAYSLIAKAYLLQSEIDVHNPDILALAQINIKKFQQDFPRDEKINQAQSDLQEMKEIFATALFETGQFYERKKKPKASVLYYHNAIVQFPETKVAEKCKERLTALKPYAEEIQIGTPS